MTGLLLLSTTLVSLSLIAGSAFSAEVLSTWAWLSILSPVLLSLGMTSPPVITFPDVSTFSPDRGVLDINIKTGAASVLDFTSTLEDSALVLVTGETEATAL